MRGEQVREQEDAWFPLPALGVWSYPSGLALLAQGVLPLLGCSPNVLVPAGWGWMQGGR